MTKFTSDRVPVVEDTLGLNLATLLGAAKKTGSSLLAVTWQGTTGLVLLEAQRMTLMLGGANANAEIAAVPCLNGRFRRLLKCPRAHEGNFQSLYWSGTELACRCCLRLRYRSTLAASPAERARLARHKLLRQLGGAPGVEVPVRQPYIWRRRHLRLLARLASLSGAHYAAVLKWLDGVKKPSALRNGNH